MKISLTMWQACITLLALDGYVGYFKDSDDPEDLEYADQIVLAMRKLIKEIPAEEMPKIGMIPHDREWNKKMHGQDVDGNLGKPAVWRIHKAAA